MKITTLTTLLLIIITAYSMACEFTVTLTDSYGDGWNENSITITVNGTIVLDTITIADGTGPENYTFNANDGDNIVITYDASGNFPSETEYIILNPNSYTVFSDGQGGVPSGGSFIADCNALPPPVFNVSTTEYTPEELITDVLITGCLEADNVEYDGDPNAIGYFTNGEIIGLTSGLILSCGTVTDIFGNDSGNDDLGFNTAHQNIADDLFEIAQENAGASSVNDIMILEFDFIPSDALTEFTFVFASEEYPTYENTQWNDVFSFFVSGPGITGSYADNAINVALVPGTTDPITISSINGDTNSEYFGEYTDSGDDINVGGYTTTLVASINSLTPCETYHIKFAIADASDGMLNSYVFFEAGSFSSGAGVTMNHISSTGEHNEILEGCENYYEFSRSDTTDLSDTLFINSLVNGSAIMGLDYSNISSSFFIEPGESAVNLQYSAFMDDIIEDENIIFTFQYGCTCSPTTTNDTIWIFDNYYFEPAVSNDTAICYGGTANLSVELNHDINLELINFNWSTGDTTSTITVSPTTTTTYTVTINDQCSQDTTLSVNVSVSDLTNIEINTTNTTCFNYCNGIATVTDITGGFLPYSYQWDVPGSTDTVTNLCSGNHYVTVFDSIGCFTEDTFSISQPSDVTVSISTTDDEICLGGNTNITISPSGGTPPYTFYWDDIDSTQTLTVSPMVQTTYTGTVIDANNCNSLTDSITIDVTPTIQLSIIPTSSTCFGNCDGTATAIFSGEEGSFTYSWSSDDEFEENLCAGNYTLTVTDENGCTISESFIIEQPLQITATTTPVPTNCNGLPEGSSATIDITPGAGTEPFTYIWSNGTIITGGTSSTINNILAGPYSVTMTDINSCSHTETITISQPDKLYLEYPEKVSACIDEDFIIELSCTGGTPGTPIDYTYEWNDDFYGSTVNFNLNKDTIYYIIAIDANRCKSDRASIIVDIADSLYINATYKDYVCIGDAASVNITYGGGKPPYSIFLQNGTIINNPFVYLPTEDDSYFIKLKDQCTTPVNSVEVEIAVEELPSVDFISQDMDGCAPFEVEFTDISPDDDILYYSWNFGDNNPNNVNISEEVKPMHTYEDPGNYSVTLTLTNEKLCVNSYTRINHITVYPVPEANFVADPIVTTVLEPNIFFENFSFDAEEYKWNFGDHSGGTNLQNTYHEFENSGEYLVTLQAYTEHGDYKCENSTTQKVIIKDVSTLFAPTAFTPEVGNENSLFFIKGEGINEDGFKMLVYNRWGELVFESNTPDKAGGWTGRIKGGDYGEPGVYTWITFYTDVNNKQLKASGQVTLLR